MGVFDADEVVPKIQKYRGWTITVKGKYVSAKPPKTHGGQWPFGFGISSITQPVGKEGSMGISKRIDQLIKGLETPKFAPTLAKGERVPPGYTQDVGGRKAPKYPYPSPSTQRQPSRSSMVRVRSRTAPLSRRGSATVQRTWRKR